MKVIPCDVPSQFIRLDLEVYHSDDSNGHGQHGPTTTIFYVGAGILDSLGALITDEKDLYTALHGDSFRIVQDYTLISDSILLPSHHTKIVAIYPHQ